MRLSNLELLRISAMFLVLMVHTAFFSMGYPTIDSVNEHPIDSLWITIIQSLSIICVNVFVLISGWFGIKLKLNSVLSLLFQVFFFLVISYIMMITLGKTPFSIKGLIMCVTIIDSMWFVYAYLLLMLMSPILNSFVEKSDKRTFKYVLIAYLIIEVTYGWLGLIPSFNGGYSVLSFIGLYLLARYLKLYSPQITRYKRSMYFIIYLCLAASLTFGVFAIAYLPILRNHFTGLSYMLFTYNNPIVIIESCAFFFIFEKIQIPQHFQRAINWIASSCFAVYLFHANPFVLSVAYKPIVQHLYESTPNRILNEIYIIVFVIMVFSFSILIDKIRYYLWTKIGVRVQQSVRQIL